MIDLTRGLNHGQFSYALNREVYHWHEERANPPVQKQKSDQEEEKWDGWDRWSVRHDLKTVDTRFDLHSIFVQWLRKKSPDNPREYVLDLSVTLPW